MIPSATLRAALACALGLLVPGAGHVFLGRRSKGGILGLSLVALFACGVMMDARLRGYWGLDDILGIVVGVGQAAVGLPYVAARLLGFAEGNVQSATFDYANTFTAAAGLLNSLVALDAWDTALGRRP